MQNGTIMPLEPLLRHWLDLELASHHTHYTGDHVVNNVPQPTTALPGDGLYRLIASEAGEARRVSFVPKNPNRNFVSK